MLEFEAALALAEANCRPGAAGSGDGDSGPLPVIDVGPAALGHAARLGATPVIPLVGAVAPAAAAGRGPWAHFGATSQDVLDTALMLVLRRALDLVLDDLARLSAAAAALAEEHRSTPIAARTLLQHAAPTTFGRKAAGWLVATVEVGEVLSEVRRHRLAVQLGGPAGTLAALGTSGPAVVEALASELGLERPGAPLAHRPHASGRSFLLRWRWGPGPPAKIALDVSLLMQTEVSEVVRAFSGRPRGLLVPAAQTQPVDGGRDHR